MDDAAEGGFDDRRFYNMIKDPETAIKLHSIDTEKGKELFQKWNKKSNRTLY